MSTRVEQAELVEKKNQQNPFYIKTDHQRNKIKTFNKMSCLNWLEKKPTEFK